MQVPKRLHTEILSSCSLSLHNGLFRGPVPNLLIMHDSVGWAADCPAEHQQSTGGNDHSAALRAESHCARDKPACTTRPGPCRSRAQQPWPFMCCNGHVHMAAAGKLQQQQVLLRNAKHIKCDHCCLCRQPSPLKLIGKAPSWQSH